MSMEEANKEGSEKVWRGSFCSRHQNCLATELIHAYVLDLLGGIRLCKFSYLRYCVWQGPLQNLNTPLTKSS
jgi:hypothetical protein